MGLASFNRQRLLDSQKKEIPANVKLARTLKTVDLDSLTVLKLQELCKRLELTGYSSLVKEDLIRLIRIEIAQH